MMRYNRLFNIKTGTQVGHYVFFVGGKLYTMMFPNNQGSIEFVLYDRFF